MDSKPVNIQCFGDFKERKIWCYDMDGTTAFEPNTIHRSVTCYIYGIVLQGTITIRYNGKLLTAGAGEMVMNMPGLNLDTEATTPDYRSIALVVMAEFNDENLSLRKVLQNAWFPIMYLRTPILPLTEIQSARLQQTMRLIQERQREAHTYSADVLQTLHSLFLLDLMDVQNGLTDLKRSPQRYDTFFISYMALLPAHFREEHELAFYADQLNISTTYLARIVRNITGRTAGGLHREDAAPRGLLGAALLGCPHLPDCLLSELRRPGSLHQVFPPLDAYFAHGVPGQVPVMTRGAGLQASSPHHLAICLFAAGAIISTMTLIFGAAALAIFAAGAVVPAFAVGTALTFFVLVHDF